MGPAPGNGTPSGSGHETDGCRGGVARKAAEYLAPDKSLGTIEAGQMADLIILSQNPIEDIRNTRKIEQVIYAGRIIDRENLPMLDPFKEGLVATARANQQVVHLKVDQALAEQFSASSSQRDGLAPVLDLPQPEGAFGSAAK